MLYSARVFLLMLTVGLLFSESALCANRKYLLSGSCTEVFSNAPIRDLEVTVTNLKNQRTIRLLTDPDGLFSVLLSDSATYQITATSGEYFSSRPIEVSTTDPRYAFFTGIDVSLKLLRRAEGSRLVVRQPAFQVNETQLGQADTQLLSDLATILEHHPALHVEFTAHTDARGSDAYNLRLSEERAKAIASFLLAAGVAAHRVKYAGRGEQQLLNHCENGVKCSASAHEENRRTEWRFYLPENTEE